MSQLIADVFDALLIDEKTGDVVASTTLTEANIDVTMESNDVRGGKGNQLLGVLHSSRDINIALTDAQVNYGFMAKQLGTDIKTGAGVAYAAPKFYDVVDNAGTKEVTLDNEPLASDHGLKVYTEDGKEITGFTVSGNVVDLSSATPTVNSGDSIEVRTYKYQTAPETQTIEFDIERLPSGVKLVLETIEIDGDETITHKLQYQFDKCAVDGAFSVNTASERSGSTQSINLRVLKPAKTTKVGRLLRIPVASA